MRSALGAEELIELGQQMLPSLPPTSRPAMLSRAEAELLVRTVDSIIAFAKGFPLEFASYCRPDRWEAALIAASTASARLQAQLNDPSRARVAASADETLAILDLNECVDGAKDARLSSAKAALIVSAVGAFAETILGIGWLGLPAYMISLALVVGRPLAHMAEKSPLEPYRPTVMSGRRRLGDHTDKAKILERVVVPRGGRIETHHWGWVRPGMGTEPEAVCLQRGPYRVRVEGWRGNVVSPDVGWMRTADGACLGRNVIVVWEGCGARPSATRWGEIPVRSGHPESYWIQYVGPLTGGACRTAGPFG